MLHVSSVAQKHGALNPKVGLMLWKWHEQRSNIKLALRQHVG